MVHLFDELVKTIPTSARLSGLKQGGQSMSLDGVAQSNASVAEYMRNIETSPWMGHADLRKTENTHNGTRMPYVFGLNVLLSKPKTDETDGKTPVLPADASSSAAPAVPAALGAAAKAVASPPAKPATTATPEARPVSAPAATGGAGS
jgi:type IV pilus assembly protein PilN